MKRTKIIVRLSSEYFTIDIEDMFANTLEIANKVEDYDIKEDLNLLPVQYKNPDKELQELAMQSLEDMRLTSSWVGNDQYEVRLVEELEIIKEKKFAPYFLVVMNMINWAKKEKPLLLRRSAARVGGQARPAQGTSKGRPFQIIYVEHCN